MRVCFSGDGQGEIAAAIAARLQDGLKYHDEVGARGPYEEWTFVHDSGLDGSFETQAPVDIAICTTGGMVIDHAGHMPLADVERMHRGNYLKPRLFTEGMIAVMRRERIQGQIIHLGSNASWYGNVGADDYAAYKTALRKYLELRGRDVRQYGIRICHLAFGGVATKFWDKATAGADPELAKTIVPGGRKPLTADEAAAVVVAAITLPENVVLRDCLIVSRDYQ